MSSQRPFLANFLAAFRARSAIKASASSTASSASSPATQTTSTAGLLASQQQTAHLSTSSSSSPSTSTSNGQTSSSATATRSISTGAYPKNGPSASNGPSSNLASAVQAAFSPPRPSARNPSSPLNRPGSTFGDRTRRSSDSSSEGGFRDAMGGEKWFIGGRTARGEERFYRLGMVTRERSGDRASCDRMSL